MKRKKIKWSWLKCARADRWHAADQNGNHANSNVGHNPRKMGCCYQKTWWCVPIPISQIVDHWRGLYLNCYSTYSKVDFKVVLKISRSRIKISNRNFSQKTNGWFFLGRSYGSTILFRDLLTFSAAMKWFMNANVERIPTHYVTSQWQNAA